MGIVTLGTCHSMRESSVSYGTVRKRGSVATDACTCELQWGESSYGTPLAPSSPGGAFPEDSAAAAGCRKKFLGDRRILPNAESGVWRYPRKDCPRERCGQHYGFGHDTSAAHCSLSMRSLARALLRVFGDVRMGSGPGRVERFALWMKGLMTNECNNGGRIGQ